MRIPSKHSSPVHPFLQPSKHAPVLGWHIPDRTQNGLHFSLHSNQYSPSWQAVKQNKKIALV